MPFKFEAFAPGRRTHAARAALAQACNMLRFDADGWPGDNTDGAGLVRDLERNADVALRGARVLLIGAGGGAAGALGPLLAAGPRELVVANRTDKRAAALVGAARDAGVAARHACCAPRRSTTAAVRFDIVVNASASSVAGAAVPVDAARAAARARWRST